MNHSVTLNNLSRCDGSALLATGETVVQAAVYGPLEIKNSQKLNDKAAMEVSFRKMGQSDCTEKLMEYHIRSVIERTILTALYPRTSIKIIIQEIQDDGNMLACSVNAACLALLDAAISMSDMVAAVCVGVFEGKIISFPSKEEIKNAKCVPTIYIKTPREKFVGIQMSGSILEDEDLKKCVDLAKQSAADIFTFYSESVQKRSKKTS